MIASLIAVWIASLCNQQADVPPFAKEFSATVSKYYQSPEPQVGPKLLHELLKKENLDHPLFAKNDYHVLNLNCAAIGDIAAGQPKIVREYEAAFAGASPAGRGVMIRVLRNCGDKDTAKRIDIWLSDRQYADLRADLETLKKDLEDTKRKHVRDLSAKEPKTLDLLWVNYFITGEYAPISRILDVLDLPDDKDNETLKRVAKWSLASNLQGHPKLVELVAKHAKDRPDASKKAVNEWLAVLQGLVGRWVSQDEDKNPMVFEKDGTFQCGFIKQDGKWVIAKGKYAIAEDGKIRTEASSEGSTLHSTYSWKDGVLTGSRGPKPKVEWKKDDDKKDKP